MDGREAFERDSRYFGVFTFKVERFQDQKARLHDAEQERLALEVVAKRLAEEKKRKDAEAAKDAGNLRLRKCDAVQSEHFSFGKRRKKSKLLKSSNREKVGCLWLALNLVQRPGKGKSNRKRSKNNETKKKEYRSNRRLVLWKDLNLFI